MVSHLAQSRRMSTLSLSLFWEIALIIAQRAATDWLGEARSNTLFASVNWGCRDIHNCASHRHFRVLFIKTNSMIYDVLYKIESRNGNMQNNELASSEVAEGVGSDWQGKGDELGFCPGECKSVPCAPNLSFSVINSSYLPLLFNRLAFSSDLSHVLASRAALLSNYEVLQLLK